MNVYDIANNLASALRNSQEYKNYQLAKDKLAINAENEKMVKKYMKKQIELQSFQMIGKELSDEQIDNFNKMTAQLMEIPEIADFFRAQMLFGRMFEDITKTITQAVDIDFGLNN